jgi:preprotein translocase subunit YajC
MTTMMSILAQAGGTAASAPTTQADAPFWATPGFMMILLIVVFIFLMFSSTRKQDKKRTQMLDKLQKGDRVQTIGGILGTVLEVREGEVVIKVDETNNIKLRFTRSAVHQVLGDEKAETK